MFVCGECGQRADAAGVCAADGEPLAPTADPLLGTDVGRYRLARVLGEGGMGRVYLAVHPGIGSRVAIKILADQCARNPELLERFFAEARAVNLIRHEGIVNILDLAQLADGRPYIVMEYIAGATLGSLVRAAPAPLGGVVQVMAEVLAALAAAHAIGIVHRDLKPDNILVTREGRAKVLDFGIAKLAPGLSNDLSPRTRTGALLGTPAYMAPEQITGAGNADARSDVYAAGVVLFEAVTGRVPFQGATLFDLMRAHLEATPPSPRAFRPDLPPPFEAVILTALAKDPAARFQSAGAMAEALRTASSALPAEAWRTLTGGRRAAPATAPPASGQGRASDAGFSALGPTHATTGGGAHSPAPHLPAPPSAAPAMQAGAAPAAQAGAAAMQAPAAQAGAAAMQASAAPAVPVAASATRQRGLWIGATVAVAAAVGIVVFLVTSRGSQDAAREPADRVASAAPPDVTPAEDRAPPPTPTEPAGAPAPDASVTEVERRERGNAPAGGERGRAGGKPAGASERTRPADPPPAERAAAEPPSAPAPAPAVVEHEVKPPAGVRVEGNVKLVETESQSYSEPIANAARFDPVAYLATATRIARRLLPDARLTSIDAFPVFAAGHVDLTVRDGSVDYRFRSPAGSQLPAGHPSNLPLERPCGVLLEVTARRASARVVTDDNCRDKLVRAPRCSLAQVWQRALAELRGAGLAATHAAKVSWLFDEAWYFDAHDRGSATVADSCP